MCDVFFCFSDAPLSEEENPRAGLLNKWQILMKNAPVENPGWCLYGGICIPCASYQLRSMALEGDLSQYKCCQGYFDLKCFKPCATPFESTPQLGLCCEVCCCSSCAISATRFHIQDNRNITSDPCDNRIIRFNNFIQCLSCIVDLLSICIEDLGEASDILDLIANIVYMCTAGCMNAQMHYELTHVNNEPSMQGAPSEVLMER